MRLQRPTTHPALPILAGVLLILGLFIGFTPSDYTPIRAALSCGSPFLTTSSDDYYVNGPIVPNDAPIGVVAPALGDADRYAQLCNMHLRSATHTAWTLTFAGLALTVLILFTALPSDSWLRRPARQAKR